MTESSEVPHHTSHPYKRYVAVLLIGFLLALILSTAIRFALIKDTSVHYHANFSLYVNGKRDEFKSFAYYEEVAACDAHDATNPKVRAHLHDQNAELVHVHDGGVTWGQLFANLGYALSNDLVENDNATYISGDDGNKLSFMLNGEMVNSIANEVIKSEDVLLINYGKDDQSTLKQRYESISRDAGKANVTKDPSACSGGHELTFWSRLKQAIGLPDNKD